MMRRRVRRAAVRMKMLEMGEGGEAGAYVRCRNASSPVTALAYVKLSAVVNDTNVLKGIGRKPIPVIKCKPLRY